MAINPNTNFTAGQVLTADQQNRFARGVVAYAQTTTSDTSITTEEVQVTASTFTAVANRYYKITYYEPATINTSTDGNAFIMRIRLTNAAGTMYETLYINQTNASLIGGICSTVVTLSAGSTVIVGTAASGGLNSEARRSAVGGLYGPAWILVEDIGPA
jgi:hypothetical protein